MSKLYDSDVEEYAYQGRAARRMEVFNILRRLCSCALLGALTVAVVYLCIFISSATPELKTIATSLDSISKLAITLNTKAEGLPSNSSVILQENLKFLRSEVAATRKDLTLATDQLVTDTNTQVTQLVAQVDTKPVVEQITELNNTVKLTLDPYRQLGEGLAKSQLIVQPEVTTLLRGWGVTGYEAATTFKDVRKAIPEVLTEIERTTKGSAESTEQSAVFFHNMAQATTPLPRWLRIGLAVAPPVAQTVFAGVAASRY